MTTQQLANLYERQRERGEDDSNRPYFENSHPIENKNTQGQSGYSDCTVTSLDRILRDHGIERERSEIAEALNYDEFNGAWTRYNGLGKIVIIK